MSAEPETRNRDCAIGVISKSQVGEGRSNPGGRGETRTVDVYCPNSAVVSVICTKTLPIMREPDVDDVVFGAGKKEIALLVEFNLR